MKLGSSSAFALPTVLVSSVIMLIVMLSAVTSTVAVRVSLDSQYYKTMSRDAGDAGLAYAKACLASNNNIAKWTNEKPLKPNTDCSGNELVVCNTSNYFTEPLCSVSVQDRSISKFEIPAPTVDQDNKALKISSKGNTDIFKSSSNEIWRQYKQSINIDKQQIYDQFYFKQISTGYNHACGIGSDDLAYCWGYNANGQLGNGKITNSSVPVAVYTTGVLAGKTIKSISAGYYQTCAIASDDLAYCWGNNGSGQLGNNSAASSSVPVAVYTSGLLSSKTIKSISSGGYHTCAIASDDLTYCWGYNSAGQLGNNSVTQSLVPVAVYSSGSLNNKTIKSISAGYYQTCSIASDDQAYCWGNNANGQLGNNTTVSSSTPVAVYTSGELNGKTVRYISTSGGFSSCAVASDGQVYCWGNNNYGQLGNNSTTQSIVPTALHTSGELSGKNIESVTTGYYQACATTSDGQVYCWGNNNYGQLGNNSTTQSLVPTALYTSGELSGRSIKNISMGYKHTCATTLDNQSYCFGNGAEGRLGTGSISNSLVAKSILTDSALSGKTILMMSSGENHTCAIASDYKAYCWGSGGNGQLGNNATQNSEVPVAVYTGGVLNGKNLKSISSGTVSTCVITTDNQGFCWGNNGNGELGNGLKTNSSVPVAIDTSSTLAGKTLKSISIGAGFACAIASDDKTYCWGGNFSGQLGNNSTAESLTPVAVYSDGVLSGKTIKSITSGRSHACEVTSDGLAYCWGYNYHGQLGNSSTTQSLIPVAVYADGVLSGKTIKSISAGYTQTCAIASNDQAYCWGYNSYGQLGNGATGDSTIPVPVDNSGALSGKTIKSISSGEYHSCAVASDNLEYCWGYNYDGELGNNSTTDSLTPVAITSNAILFGKTIKSITTGKAFSCAIASDNKTYCWGSSYSGQLGNSALHSRTAVAVYTGGVLSGKTIKNVSAGSDFSCTIASNDLPYCWGSSLFGRLGDSLNTKSQTPVAVDVSGTLSGKTVKSIATGYYHACAIASDNLAYCWGDNNYGKLGDNTTTDSYSPVAVYTGGALSGKTVTAISANFEHTCAIASDSLAYCWGYNQYGQLGDNTTVRKTSPNAVDVSGVLSGKTITAISTGFDHTCAIASDGKAYCWGSNAYGQLGNDSTTNSSVPVAVDTSGVLSGKTITAISIGQYTSCAIASDSKAYCWGSGSSGRLGNNTSANSQVPVAVYATSGALYNKTIKSISSGPIYTCVIASDNLAYCWGSNLSNVLGSNFTYGSSSVPVAVSNSGFLSDKTIKSISSGNTHVCVVASNNLSYCWGANDNNQLGDNKDISTNPISVLFKTYDQSKLKSTTKFFSY